MIVYQTNQSGIYTGVTYADPDPLDVGEWLVPAGCVTAPPPSIPHGHVAVYSGGAWSLAEHTDPDTAPDVETEPPTLDQIRASTSIDRAAFCNGLADAGVITDAEAIAAARGEWPSSFAGFLDYLNATQSRDAQITWASCVTVQRNHEFVVSLAWWTNLSDEQVDALFGIKI